MKPKDRAAALSKLKFRPEEQPGLFASDGPVVLLYSDVKRVLAEFVAEFDEYDIDIRGLRREITELRRSGKKTGVTRRPVKHLFPELMTVGEEGRVRRICGKYGANFDSVISAARLYSEQNAVKYASWPAAIEVAMANDYQWIRAARNTAPPTLGPRGERQPTEKQLAARERVAAAKRAKSDG